MSTNNFISNFKHFFFLVVCFFARVLRFTVYPYKQVQIIANPRVATVFVPSKPHKKLTGIFMFTFL